MKTFKTQLKNVLLKITAPDRPIYEFLPLATRSDDIYLASFPKSGNTYAAFMIANVMSEYLKLGMDINFFNIHFFVPDIHSNRDIPYELLYPPFKRIIKSHARNDRYYRNILLIVRNPLDVMNSYYVYTKNQMIYSGDFSSFIRHEKYGINAWADHSQSWLEQSGRHQNLQLLYYEKLSEEPEIQLKRIFTLMGFTISDEIIRSAVQKSNFENMQRIESETISYSTQRFKKFKFVTKDNFSDAGLHKQEDIDYMLGIARPMMDKLGYK